MNETRQPTLIITGMHRSETSLVSSLLQSAGLDIGKNLLPEGEGNPKGHFENVEFLNFHENVLSSLGIDKVGWTLQNKLTPPCSFLYQARQLIDKNQSLTQPWGWKEPRTTLFLDFWANLIPSAYFLFIFRCPWEVLDSIYRRGDIVFHRNPYLAIQSWDSYNQAILSFYKHNSSRCLIYNLNQIIADPNNLINDIQKKFGISLSQVDKSIYEQDLLKQDISKSFERPWLIKNYFPLSLDIYEQLNQFANYEDCLISQLPETPNAHLWILQDWLDIHLLKGQLKGEINHLDRCYQEIGDLRHKIGTLEWDLQQSQQESTQKSKDLEEMRSHLEDFKREFQEIQSHLQQELEETRQHLTKSEEDFNQMRSHLQQELEETRSHLSQAQQELEEMRSHFEDFEIEFQEIQSHLQQELEETREYLTKSEEDFNLMRSHLQQQLEETRSHLNRTQQELEETKRRLQEDEEELPLLRGYFEKSQRELKETQDYLQETQVELNKMRSYSQALEKKIKGMESSKFWQIRSKWFKVKRGLNLTNE